MRGPRSGACVSQVRVDSGNFMFFDLPGRRSPRLRVRGLNKCNVVSGPRSLITLGHPWTCDVTYVTLETRLPLLTRATLEKIGEPGDEAKLQLHRVVQQDHNNYAFTMFVLS